MRASKFAASPLAFEDDPEDCVPLAERRNHFCARGRVSMCVSVFVYMYVCINISFACVGCVSHTCIRTCLQVYMHTCMHLDVRTSAHARVYVCIHIYICMYTHIHTYIHIYMQMYIYICSYIHAPRCLCGLEKLLGNFRVCVSVPGSACPELRFFVQAEAVTWPHPES